MKSKIIMGKDKTTGKDKLQIFQPINKRKLEEEKLLKKYPKIFRQKDLPMTQTGMCWGLECGLGWFWLIDNLCGCIQSYIDNNAKYNPEIFQVEAVQVKEKFGGLRFYTNGECKEIHGMIWLAEQLSCYICENCGSTENVTQNNKGWIRSLCSKCRKIYKQKKQ
jgi:hypothetical protein